MKAIIATEYGSPDVLRLVEVQKPSPLDNEVLIKVHAGAVGPADCAFRKGEPFIIKLMYGFPKPKLAFQGVEFAGKIETIGKDVTQFKKGDEVFGISVDKFGAHAEYLCIDANKVIGIKPSNLSFQESVGVIDGALTSLVFLRDKAKIKKGDKILINGASGAVGGYAVQLAKYYGAEVTGVCSTKNLELVKSLGADQVIDYTKEDFTNSKEKFDIVFDAVGKASYGDCKDILVEKGIFLETVPSADIIFNMISTWKSKSKKAIFAPTGLQQKKENLAFLKELCESGKLKPYIDRVYPLKDIVEAHKYVETGHKKGNVIISID